MGIDNKLRQTVNVQAQYFLNDHLGSTNALADASGDLLASTSYDSFGNALNSNFPTRYQFTGREFDNFTGLQYSRARWYDANLGRFISEDPIGFAGGDVNLFGYVRNNPISYTDPSGLIGLCVGSYGRIMPCGLNLFDQVGGAYNDFADHYMQMRNASGGLQNPTGTDKFFHCMANCQSAKRGYFGSLGSLGISEFREQYQEKNCLVIQGKCVMQTDLQMTLDEAGEAERTLAKTHALNLDLKRYHTQ